TDDIIRADDPDIAPSGASLRVLHVEAMVPVRGLSLLQVTIPSLPPGFSIANATLTDNGWVVDVDLGNIEKLTQTTDATGAAVPVPASQSMFSFELELIYALPDRDTPVSAGFQDEFFLPVQLGLSSDGTNSTNAVEVPTHFGIKLVDSADD
ncbi:hypothetical protein, partial [Adlercreutzia mucosicola]|uniref:hypothetical protein n=1 Tax=Adlercreutzia mucosicola TaxID=580026 RepID=UPI002B24C9CE